MLSDVDVGLAETEVLGPFNGSRSTVLGVEENALPGLGDGRFISVTWQLSRTGCLVALNSRTGSGIVVFA